MLPIVLFTPYLKSMSDLEAQEIIITQKKRLQCASGSELPLIIISLELWNHLSRRPEFYYDEFFMVEELCVMCIMEQNTFFVRQFQCIEKCSRKTRSKALAHATGNGKGLSGRTLRVGASCDCVTRQEL